MTGTVASPAVPTLADVPPELAALGVRDDTLDAGQAAALDRDGCLVLPARLAPDALAALRAACDRLMAEKYGDATPGGSGPSSDFWFHERGTRRLADLTSDGEEFERLAVDPALLAAVHRLMRRPFKLDTINAREALPGEGHQDLHRDRTGPARPSSWGVNSAWMLDDFTAVNGATRYVPGTQRVERDPGGALASTSAPHPDERLAVAPAGSVFVFCNHLWHGGTANRSPRGRRAVFISFAYREQDLGARAQRLRIRKAVWERLSPAARWLLDV